MYYIRCRECVVCGYVRACMRVCVYLCLCVSVRVSARAHAVRVCVSFRCYLHTYHILYYCSSFVSYLITSCTVL